MRIRAADAAVTCACLMGVAVFLVLFQRDMNRTLRRLDREPAGFVASRTGAALRRFEDRNIWDRLRTESPVYNGDFIRTAVRSGAAVGFPGGSRVDVSENSLIRIFMEEGVPRVDFSRGAVSVRAGEAGGLYLSFGGTRIWAAAGTAASLGGGEEGPFTFQVLEGSATLTGPGGEREAAAGAVLVIGADGVFREPPRTAALDPPPVTETAAAPSVTAAEPPPSPAAAAVEPRHASPPPTRPPLLPAPSGREPGNGYRVDPATLRDSRTIAFKWNPVAGADAYVFTLFQETGSGERRTIVSSGGPETSYTLEDLRLLNPGRLVWRVEAVGRGADGAVERRGTPGENRFTVDIPQPDVPQGRDPGILYGR
jgi:hypothetical protein